MSVYRAGMKPRGPYLFPEVRDGLLYLQNKVPEVTCPWDLWVLVGSGCGIPGTSAGFPDTSGGAGEADTPQHVTADSPLTQAHASGC